MNLLKQIEKEQMAKLSAGKQMQDFQQGDQPMPADVADGQRSPTGRERALQRLPVAHFWRHFRYSGAARRRRSK